LRPTHDYDSASSYHYDDYSASSYHDYDSASGYHYYDPASDYHYYDPASDYSGYHYDDYDSASDCAVSTLGDRRLDGLWAQMRCAAGWNRQVLGIRRVRATWLRRYLRPG
jgi:hypothetical protein